MDQDKFLLKMENLLGADYLAFKASMNEPLYKGLRVNLSKISTKDFLNIFQFDTEPVNWCEEGFYLTSSEIKLGKTPLYFAGLFYLQEPSAMIPAVALDAQEGDKILDIAAAPGGKSTQIAAQIGKSGLLVANDISPKRTIALAKNLAMNSGGNSVVLNNKPEHLSPKFHHYFDRVLVDAPCSGEGLYKKNKKHFENDNEKYAIMQRSILSEIPNMLKNGGILVYSTCTFSPVEDENMIEWFLEQNEDFELVDIDIPGLDDGRPDWSNGDENLTRTKRAWPHKIKGEGHFIAKLRRKGKEEIKDVIVSKYEINEENLLLLKKFIECMKIDLNKFTRFYERIYERDEFLYLLPEGMDFDVPRKFVKCGVLLGEIKRNKFIPDTEFALILNESNCGNTVEFLERDMNVMKYLKGETINAEVNNGYCLITVSGYGLGFAIANDNILKNKYKKQWRML